MAEGGRGRSAGAGRIISIDELGALNDEIAALVRAGVPLERGLLRAGSDLSGGLKRITQALGSRLSRGESLGQALEAEKAGDPAALPRGGRGRGPVGPAARRARGAGAVRAELLRGPQRPSAWPSGIRSSSCRWPTRLFLGLVVEVIPRFIGAFESLGLDVITPLRWLERVGELAPYWWPVVAGLARCSWGSPGGGRASRPASRRRPGR